MDWREWRRHHDSPPALAAFGEQLRALDAFAPLEGNLSADGVVAAWRTLGAERLADELSAQDLTRYLAFLRNVGF